MNNIQYEQTELNNLIGFLMNQTDKDSEENKIFSSYIDLQKQRYEELWNNSNAPFLSVITRTQGKRPDMLTETLLSLTGQRDTDFELLVLGHNLNDDQNNVVAGIIEDLPDWMRKQTRFIPVNGGTRTTPLNRGFEEAKGKYIAILDDDDIVFDNWVEKFKEYANKEPGKIIHSYTIYQDWEIVGGKYPNTPISVNKPSSVFCQKYLQEKELVINVCPPVGIAFPAYPFKYLGIKFDETLTTNEDWDFLNRTEFITGLVNCTTPTCLYRNWLNTENSQTLHSQKEWDANYNKIVDRFKTLPMLFQNESTRKIIDENLNSNGGMLSVDTIKLYYDDGYGYQEGSTIRPIVRYGENTTIEFNLETLPELKSVRIDPNETGNLFISNFNMIVEFANNKKQSYSLNELKSNGFLLKEKVVFIKNDPQLSLTFDNPAKLNSITCIMDITSPIPNEIIDAAIIAGAKNARKAILKNWLKKPVRFLLRIIKGALKK